MKGIIAHELKNNQLGRSDHLCEVAAPGMLNQEVLLASFFFGRMKFFGSARKIFQTNRCGHARPSATKRLIAYTRYPAAAPT
jgi:hypothetical protein